MYGYPDKQQNTGVPNGGANLLTPKVFGSPSEFFEHLFWLMTAPDLNRGGCTCRNCSPAPEAIEAPQSLPPPTSTAPTRPIPARRQVAPASTPEVAQGMASPAPPVPGRAAQVPASRATPGRRQGVAIPAPGAPGAPQGSVAPTPVAPNRPTPPGRPVNTTPTPTISPSPSFNPILTPQPDESLLFREGEVVWFRKAQEAFRLGIILQNIPGDPAVPFSQKSRIKPLSHHQKAIEDVERSEADMRPFLTFSVPDVREFLRSVADKPMVTVLWGVLENQLLKDGQTSGELLSLEASKIAAIQIDHSYSLFNTTAPPNAPLRQRSFGGVFFGCEKIGIFEAVRVHVDQQEHQAWNNPDIPFVMVVKGIVLDSSESGDRLLFQGDIWLLQESNSPQHVNNTNQLPPSMRREKMFRDEVKQPHGTHFDWIQVATNAVKPETSIRGRFYESRKLGPMLSPQWGQYLQSGIIPPIHKSLNNRGDSKGMYIGRKSSRLETVIGAIPHDTVLSLGPHVMEWS